MEAAEVLKKAFAAVEEAQLPDNLRLVAFERAIDLFSRPSANATENTRLDSRPANGKVAGQLADVAKELEIYPEQMDRLFDEYDGALQFVGDLTKFGSTTAEKMRGLAIIYLVARQYGRYEDASSDEGLRSELGRHGILDTKNYSTNMNKLKAYFNINKSGRKAIYKAKFEGRKKARELAKSVLES